MASNQAQKGRLLILYVLGPASEDDFVVVGGIQSSGITTTGGTADITNKDSNGFQTLLAGAGVTKWAIKGNGVLLNDQAHEILEEASKMKTLETLKITEEDGTEYLGSFQITSWDVVGDHAKEVTFTLAAESSGEIVKTPVS